MQQFSEAWTGLLQSLASFVRAPGSSVQAAPRLLVQPSKRRLLTVGVCMSALLCLIFYILWYPVICPLVAASFPYLTYTPWTAMLVAPFIFLDDIITDGAICLAIFKPLVSVASTVYRRCRSAAMRPQPTLAQSPPSPRLPLSPLTISFAPLPASQTYTYSFPLHRCALAYLDIKTGRQPFITSQTLAQFNTHHDTRYPLSWLVPLRLASARFYENYDRRRLLLAPSASDPPLERNSRPIFLVKDKLLWAIAQAQTYHIGRLFFSQPLLEAFNERWDMAFRDEEALRRAVQRSVKLAFASLAWEQERRGDWMHAAAPDIDERWVDDYNASWDVEEEREWQRRRWREEVRREREGIGEGENGDEAGMKRERMTEKERKRTELEIRRREERARREEKVRREEEEENRTRVKYELGASPLARRLDVLVYDRSSKGQWYRRWT
jgi:hypothetical protein